MVDRTQGQLGCSLFIDYGPLFERKRGNHRGYGRENLSWISRSAIAESMSGSRRAHCRGIHISSSPPWHRKPTNCPPSAPRDPMLKPRPVHPNTVLKSPLHTRSLRRELPILNLTHQLLKLLSILNLYPRNPALALRSFIDSARLLLQDVIRFYDLPRHGRHDV